MKRGPSKGKYVRGHKKLGKNLDAHERQAILGQYAKVGIQAMRIVTLGRHLADEKREISSCRHPEAIKQYTIEAARFGEWMADALSSEGGDKLLESVARLSRDMPPGGQFVYAPEQDLTSEQFTGLSRDENGLKAVKFRRELNQLVGDKAFGLQMRVDSARLTVAVAARMKLGKDPKHLFSIPELLSLCRPIEVSDKTMRRIAHDFGLPLVGPGAPLGTKQSRR